MLDRLAALAGAATPGARKVRSARGLPCFVEVAPPGSTMPYGLELLGDDYTGFGEEQQRERDAAFIAACDPTTILALVEVAKAAKAVAFSNGFDAAYPDKLAALRSALKTVELGQA